VVAASPVADWGNPNVVRASKGTVFAMPVASAPAGDVAAWLDGHGVASVVATPEADASIGDVDLTGPTAIVVGAEHAGVSSDLRAHAAATARIPMHGRVNSLNVSIASAIALYEARRQRGPRT
jgi:TrmH family RNA methyltransferase